MAKARDLKNDKENIYVKEKILYINKKTYKPVKLEIKDNWDFANSFEEWLKTIDRKMYMKIFNKLKK